MVKHSKRKLAMLFSCFVAITAILLTMDSTGDGLFTSSLSWPMFILTMQLHDLFSYLARVTVPSDVYTLNLATAWWKSEVVYALTLNGIIDAVAKAQHSVSCDDVAAALSLQPFVVCELMKAGAQLHLLRIRHDTLTDTDTDRYSLTDQGAWLASDGEYGTLRDYALMANDESRDAWRAISVRVIRSGNGSGWEAAFNKSVWHFLTELPEKEAQFNRAMVSHGVAASAAFVSDWRPPNEDILFCDIGGGVGSSLAAILEKYPAMHGILFDRPSIVASAEKYLKQKNLTHRAVVIGGSFFETLPAELARCNIYYLRFILHDWPDSDAVRILDQIRRVATSERTSSKKSVAVMGYVVQTGAPSFMEQFKSLFSIGMMAWCPYGSRERTVAEHKLLFRSAGFVKAHDVKVTALRSVHTILEVEI